MDVIKLMHLQQAHQSYSYSLTHVFGAKTPKELLKMSRDNELVATFIRDYWLHNESPDWAIDNIRFENKDEDLTITYPTRLEANGTAKVTIKFTPPIVRRTPLDEPTVYEGVLLIG